MATEKGRPRNEEVRKIFCEIVEGVVYSDRCLYKLSKVIEGNKSCEDCILRRVEKFESCGKMAPNIEKKKRGRAGRSRRARKKIPLTSLSGIPKEEKETIKDASQVLKQIYSTREMSGLLGKSERRIRELAQEGKIPAHKVGKAWRFPKEEMDHWLSEKRGNSVTAIQAEKQQEPKMPIAQAPEWMDPEPMEW